MLDEKLVEAKKQLSDLKVQLKELNNSGDENRAGTFDDGASNWQREHLSKLAARQQKFIRNLEYALIRITEQNIRRMFCVRRFNQQGAIKTCAARDQNSCGQTQYSR